MPKNSKDTLSVKADSLKAAIVTAVMRPRMKGDTLEYNVSGISMQPYSVVEDLLRRLPGMQVDINGNITYNGQKIDHLLVDGQDIFGSSPTLVTRNFDAGKIASIQILDRISDNALFTGIDDGKRTKTLNLVLKESAKNGYFGKVEAGGNTDQYYNCNGILAEFRDKQQLTAVGITSNTGVLQVDEGEGGIGFVIGGADPLGASAGTGIPRYNAIALHYANTLNKAGDHTEGNYQFSDYFTRPVTSTQSLQTQSDSVYGQNQQSQSVNSRNMHTLNAGYEWNPNGRSQFRFGFRGSSTTEHNQYSSAGNSTFNDTLVNSSLTTIQDRMNRQSAGGDVAWRTTIGRQASRIFSVTAELRNVDATTSGYLYSLDRFYEPNGMPENIDTVDQRKQIVSHALHANGNINYTQPLWKGPVLGISYGLSLNADRPVQATYDKAEGSYNEIVDSLSSFLKTQTLNQNITLTVQGKSGHLKYTIGNDWLVYSYHQQDLVADSSLHLHYFNWAPRLLLNYTPDQKINVGFHYSATTQQPSISQLAPIVNNDNPLYITLGNPGLKPGLSQTFGLEVNRFTAWIMNLELDMTLTKNGISTKTTTDSLGRQTSQPVNVDGGAAGKINFSVNRHVLGVDAGASVSGSYSRSFNYINADLSRNDSYTGGGGITVNKYVTDQLNFQINSNVSYYNQISSINTAAPVHYWTQNHSAALAIFLIPHFSIGTNAIYTWQEGTIAFAKSTSVMLWNSYVTRNFYHNRLVIKVQFNNMLNQNAGISRSGSANVNTETSTNILGRYWLLSAIYHFDKKFKK